MADSWAELQRISDVELIRRYDETAKQTQLGLDYYRQEIMLRSQERVDRAMMRYTKQVTILTWVTVALAAVAVVISLLSLLVSLHPHP